MHTMQPLAPLAHRMHTACTPHAHPHRRCTPTPCTRHAQVHQLCEAAAYLPDASLRFNTLSELLRYFGSRRFAQPTTGGSAPEVEADPVGAADRRTALAALWQEALYALPGAATTPPAQMAPLLRRASALSRRPASVALRCRSVRVGFAPRRVLNAAYGALAADLASRGVVYGSASSLLDAVRGEACNPMCSAPQPRACRL